MSLSIRTRTWERHGALSPSSPLRGMGEAYPQLGNLIPSDFRREWNSLALERDPEVFFHGVFQLGQRLEASERPEAAAGVYAWLMQTLLPRGQATPASSHDLDSTWSQDLRRRAEARLQLLQGSGDFGPRAEFLLRRLATEATDPVLLGGMAGAQWVFGATRLGLMGVLSGSRPTAFPWVRKGLASLGALGTEGLAFVGLTRSLRALAGTSQEGGRPSLEGEIAHTYLALGALRLTGVASGAIYRRTLGARPSPSLLMSHVPRAGEMIFSQSAMLGGLFLSSRLASHFGWSPEQTNSQTLVDSLAMWLQFNVAGQLLNRWGGRRWPSTNSEMRGRENLLFQMGRETPPVIRPLVTPEGITVHLMQGAGDPSPRLTAILNKSRPTPYPVTTRPARIFHLLNGVSGIQIPSVLFEALDRVLPGTRLLQIFSDYQAPAGPVSPMENGLQELRVNLSRTLYDSPTLSEIRVHLGDGSLLWVARNGNGRMLYGYENLDKGRELEKSRRFPENQTETMFLLAPFTPETELSLWSRAFQLLRRGRALTRGDMAERLNKRTGAQTNEYEVAVIEHRFRNAPQFRRLAALSEIFQVDRSDLIELINLNRSKLGLFPGIDPADWRTPDYPIYFETSADLERLRIYKQTDPHRESFGWLLYSRRKNPARYRFTTDVNAETGIDDRVIARLEKNHPHYLEMKSFIELEKALGVPLADLLRAYNRTHFPQLNLESLFPGQALYLNPESEDVAKLQHYQENPGSLGQLAFAARQAQEGFPSCDAMDRMLGRRRNYWRNLEWNRVEFTQKNWREWVGLFSHLNLPLEALAEPLSKLGLPLTSAPVLLAHGLGMESIADLSERSGIAPATVSGAMLPRPDRAPAVLLPETLLDLQRYLPRLRGDLVYLGMHPEVADFFPQLSFSNPVLYFPRADIAGAARFHLGELFFAERMERDWHYQDLAHHLGVPQEDIIRHETRTVGEVDMDLIHRAKRILGIDPRIVYLHFRPQILRLFEWRDPGTEEAYRLSEEEYQDWLRVRNALRDPTNRRGQLRAALQARGIPGEAGLARHLGVSPNEAKKFLKSSRALNVEDIRQITSAFPEFSYRAWYENFFAPPLAYFLGRNSDGSFDYRLPEGLTLAGLENLNLSAQIRQAVESQFPSIRAAVDATGLPNLGNWGFLARSIQDRTWSHLTMARVARELKLDRRMIFLYMKLPELRGILEGVE